MSKEITQAVEAAKEVSKAMPDVQTKVVQMLDALQNGAVKVGDTVVKYSPDIADAALWVVRIDGIQQIVYGFLALICFVATIKQMLKFVAWGIEHTNCNTPGIILPMLAFIPYVIVLIPIQNLVDVWKWIAVFEPKLYLAKQIVSTIIK